jgi:hypothetical protein
MRISLLGFMLTVAEIKFTPLKISYHIISVTGIVSPNKRPEKQTHFFGL